MAPTAPARWAPPSPSSAHCRPRLTAPQRRAAARDIVLERFPRARLIFIESVCHDEAIIRSNIRETKLNSPDYAAMPTERALEDFRRRIAHYERTYEPMVEEEGLSYIKVRECAARCPAVCAL